jgi:hypothetical protein
MKAASEGWIGETLQTLEILAYVAPIASPYRFLMPPALLALLSIAFEKHVISANSKEESPGVQVGRVRGLIFLGFESPSTVSTSGKVIYATVIVPSPSRANISILYNLEQTLD